MRLNLLYASAIHKPVFFGTKSLVSCKALLVAEAGNATPFSVVVQCANLQSGYRQKKTNRDLWTIQSNDAQDIASKKHK